MRSFAGHEVRPACRPEFQCSEPPNFRLGSCPKSRRSTSDLSATKALPKRRARSIPLIVNGRKRVVSGSSAFFLRYALKERVRRVCKSTQLWPLRRSVLGKNRSLIAAFVLFAVTACVEGGGEMVPFHARGINYSFPKEVVSASAPIGEAWRRPRIRLELRKLRVEIEYDERAYSDVLRAGPFPVIPHITTAAKLSELRSAVVHGINLVCMTNGSRQCGTIVEDAGLRWTLIFKPEQIGQVDRLVANAKRALASYRVDDRSVAGAGHALSKA